MAEGESLGDARGEVVLGKVGALAPFRLTVVHLEHLEDAGIFLGALFLAGEDEIVLVGAHVVAALGDIRSK